MNAINPFLRWAGGKRALAPLIISSFPTDFDPTKNRFFEPFVGGGAVMLALADQVPGSRLVINDVNPDLICAYRALQSDLPGLLRVLKKYSADTSIEAFEAMRTRKTKNNSECAARFIYLNKLCFNGLWRVNSSGQFNVPYAHLKNPNVIDEPLLTAVNARLQGAQIRQGPYVTALADAKAGDVVYFDPPYLPLNAASFSKYAKDDFSKLDHYALAGVVRGLTDRGVRVILSNADTPDTRQIFGNILDLRKLSVARSIAAAGASRQRAAEVLGYNYEPLGPASQLPAVRESGAGVTR